MENALSSPSARQCCTVRATPGALPHIRKNALGQSEYMIFPSAEVVGTPLILNDRSPNSRSYLDTSSNPRFSSSQQECSPHERSAPQRKQTAALPARTPESLCDIPQPEGPDGSCANEQQSGSTTCRGCMSSRNCPSSSADCKVRPSVRRGRLRSDELPGRTSLDPPPVANCFSHEVLEQWNTPSSCPSRRRFSRRSPCSRSKSVSPPRMSPCTTVASVIIGKTVPVDAPTASGALLVSPVSTHQQCCRRPSFGSTGVSCRDEKDEETSVFYECGNTGVACNERSSPGIHEDGCDSFQDCDNLTAVASSSSPLQSPSGVSAPDSLHVSLYARTHVRPSVPASSVRTEERTSLFATPGGDLPPKSSRRRSSSSCKRQGGEESSFAGQSEASASVPLSSPQGGLCSRVSSQLSQDVSSSSTLRCPPSTSPPSCTPIAPASPCPCSPSSSSTSCSSRAVEVSPLPPLFHAVSVHASPPVPEAPVDSGRDALVYPSYSRASTTSLASSVSAHPPPALDAGALEPTETDVAVDTLNIVSFNAGLLEYRLCGIQIYQNPPFTRRRLSHIPVSLLDTKADIICLQEVYDDVHADFLVDSMRHVFPYVGRRTSGGRFALHNGLMVLSRFPILHTRFHPFHDVTYIERLFGSKGMLECSIDIPGVGVAAVFNIHLASGAVDPESPYVEALRSAEILQVLSACEDAGHRGEVPIVVGDLNAAPDLCASNYKSFVERGWRDCWLLVHGNREALLRHHLVHQEQMLLHQDLNPEDLAERQKAVQLELAHLLQQHKIQRKLLDNGGVGTRPDFDGERGEARKKKKSGGSNGNKEGGHAEGGGGGESGGLETARQYLYGESKRAGGQGEDSDGYYFALSPTDYALGKRQQSGKACLLGGGDTREDGEGNDGLSFGGGGFQTGKHDFTSAQISLDHGAETPFSCHTGAHMIGKNSGDHVVVQLAEFGGEQANGEGRSSNGSPGRSKSKGLSGGGGGNGGGSGRGVDSFSPQDNTVDLEAGRKTTSCGGGSSGVCTPGKTAKKSTEEDEEQRQQLLSEALLATTSKVQQKVAWHQQTLEARRDGRIPWAPGIGGAAISAAAEDSEATTTDDAEEWLLRKKSEGYRGCLGSASSSYPNGSVLPQQRIGGGGGRGGGGGGLTNGSCSGSASCRRRASSLLPNSLGLSGVRSGDEDLYESGGLLIKQDGMDEDAEECGDEEDWADREDFTWDPQNPLNSIGPHAGCHGLRCDYVFLPPQRLARGLREFVPVSGEILLREPRVMVDACCFGCLGQVMLVTLSDHYAFKVTLQRSSFDHSLTAIHSPSMVLALKEANLFCGLPGIPLDGGDDEGEEDEKTGGEERGGGDVNLGGDLEKRKQRESGGGAAGTVGDTRLLIEDELREERERDDGKAKVISDQIL